MGLTFFENISATFFCILVVVHAIEFQDKLEVNITGRSQSQSIKGALPDDYGIHLESWNLTKHTQQFYK